MGVKKVRLMITNEDGTEEQVYPLTDVNAVHGLKEFLTNGQLKIGVMSVNGQSGDITIPVLDEEDYVELTEMLEAYEKGEIGGEKGDKGDKGDTGDPGKDGAGVENIKLHRAWAWNADGTDRFTTVYPNENLIVGAYNKAIIREVGSYWIPAYTYAKPDYPEIFKSDAVTFRANLVSSDENKGVYVRLNVHVEGNANPIAIETALVPAGGKNAVTYTIDHNLSYTKIVLAYANVVSGGPGYNFTVTNEKFELSDTATIYTPSPLDDFDGAYPTHEGLYFGFDDPSSDPTNYKPFARILGQQGEPGTNATDVVATDTTNGLMSKEDKAKLDSFNFINIESEE